MPRRGLIGLLAVALAATGIAVAEAGGGASRPEPFKPLPQHRVAAPNGPAAKVRGFSKVKYFVSNPVNIAPQTEITGSLKCPRRSAAISGFFQDNKSQVVLDYSSVGNTVRKWDFGVFNFNAATSKVLVGVVCIK
jgi:hypothetical protein